MTLEVAAEFPDLLQGLFQPKRYKVLYGGRGGAKSWGVARALLLEASRKNLRILCARELQHSIADSVHRLLTDQIHNMGLDGIFLIEKQGIRCTLTGSEFSFEGIRHNIGKIRSYEGVDICWVEEANSVSKSSWETLIPTIRKEQSEIWLTFNPELESDETYKRFVVDPPPNAWVQLINWRDNPWFPEVLREEKDALKIKNFDAYMNVWEGKCRQMLDGAVYANEIRDAQAESRFTVVPYSDAAPVDCFFDLGQRDNTAIWFGQRVGFQYRIIDYFQYNQRAIGYYLKLLQKKEYIYGTIWLPHDARAKTIGSELSVEEQTRKMGFRVRVVPKLSISDGINAARTVFGECWFDEKACQEGIQCLRHYRYDIDEKTKAWSKEPIHDQYSHGADAFRYLAVALKEPKKRKLVEDAKSRIADVFGQGPGGLSWLGM